MSVLARWSSAYDVYLDIRGDNLTTAKRKGTTALRILRELGSAAAALTQTAFDDEKEWDAFCPMFQNVVALAQDIVESDLEATAASPLHCMDMAIVGLLFKVWNPLAVFKSYFILTPARLFVAVEIPLPAGRLF
jgi:hypothetical protein